MGLERSPLGLVSTIEELPGRKSSGSGLENRGTAEGFVALTTRNHISAQLGLTSLASGGRSFGIVRSRTEVKAFVFLVSFL
jgi:hypothetical protein